MVPEPVTSEDVARAFARLAELASGLHLHSDWSSAVITSEAGGTHVSLSGTATGNFQVKGSGNYLFSSAGVETTRMHVILNAVDSFVYVGPGAVCDDLTVVRMTGGHSNLVYIGAKAHLVRASILVNGPEARVIIGANCVLEYGNIVTNSDGHSVFDVESGSEINRDADVLIGEDVFVGADAMINKGAQIGRGSVVAARSVVQSALPAQGYHVGFPARCRRRGISWIRDSAPTSVMERNGSSRMEPIA